MKAGIKMTQQQQLGAAKEKKTDEPIRLLWHDQTKTVFVQDDSEDRTVYTVREAIRACRAIGKEKEFQQQFLDLRTLLYQWIIDHTNETNKAYLTVRDTNLLFLVKKSDPKYNQEFESQILNLDREIANSPDFNMIRLDVLGVPECDEDDIATFMSPKSTYEFLPYS